MLIGHGDDIYDYSGLVKHNFSSNVFLDIQMTGLKEHLCQRINDIDHYPPAMLTALERQLSILLRNNQWENIITNGATEAIYLLAQATGAGCRSAILVPTFSEYEDACRMHGHEIQYIRSLREVNDEMNMVWLCNPNNPTGMLIPREEIVNVAFNHPNVVFVIDQSYEYFCAEEQLQPREASSLGNVIQLHSMTKKYSIPGIRLGYVTGPKPLMDTLRNYRMPWSVNAMAVAACEYILTHQEQFSFDIKTYLEEVQRLRLRLNSIDGITVLPTKTNFMLLHIPSQDAIVLKRKLVDDYGILVRAAHNFVGLDRHYIRVATQSAESNDLLVEAMKAVMLSHNDPSVLNRG